ncbi:hypothetical protein TRFO_17884 [Tritrichomonas foetus]|uniref:Uncharacterized protein n=1 Tax=Tritrichomonas foetus TaxID=1144522 RepID=A0A1J4KMD7_9EUKA|nr:hypothetical protein TRFO_17884 [Tritrichomonas foetus]|eukprot:OHT12306.1 hypothetical protein TRFO_17884 [Tritrichomonas foetus]
MGMSRKSSSSRLTPSQALLIQNPRLYGTTQNTQQPRPHFRNRPITPQIPVIPAPQPINAPPTEPNQLQVLMKLFHTLSERIALLISHNGSNYDFRTTLSHMASEVERLFGVFYKQALQQCGTMPVLQQGIKPGLASGTSALRKSAIPFLKKWREFATSLIESQVYGPESIFQSIENHFEFINMCLANVLAGKPEPSDCHDPSQRICMQFQMQLANIKSQVTQLLSQPTQNTMLKQLAEDIKEYSRRLSEAFGREFLSSGVTPADLSILKTKTYSSCSDIIHGMRAAFLFETDFKTVLEAFDEFQDLLSTILERLNLPQSYLYIRNSAGPGGTPRSNQSEEDEEDISDFDSELDIFETIRQGQKMSQQIAKQESLFLNFIKALTAKAKQLNKTINEQKDEYSALEASKDEMMHNYEEMLETERYTNQSMADELNKLKDDVDAKDKELEYLRKRTEDNEFKKCLRGVARQLGEVLKEESVNFEDEDDDQLIQYVNALSVYVVERKCSHCRKYASREEKIKELIGEIVKKEIEDEDLINKCERAVQKVEKLRNKYHSTVDKNKELDLNLNEHKQCLLQLIQGFDYPVNEEESLINQTLIAAKLDHEKHIAEIESLNNRRINQLNNLTSMVLSQVNPMIHKNEENNKSEKVEIDNTNVEEKSSNENEPENEESKNEIKEENVSKETENVNKNGTSINDTDDDAYNNQILPILGILKSQYDKDLYDLQALSKSVTDLQIRLAKHLNIKPPNMPLYDSINEMLRILETRTNPLQPLVAKLENDYKQAITSVEIISNRLRGITQYNSNEPTANMKPDDLINHALRLLDRIQDIMDRNKRVFVSTNIEMISYRKTLENLDCIMHKFLAIDDVDLKKFGSNEIITRVTRFCNAITSPGASKNFIKISDINEMFQKGQKIVQVETYSEPEKYIPLIVSTLVKLDKSVEELKPFSNILDDIFNQFNCKIEAFNPNSPSFYQINQQIIQMNKLLENISPVKINAIIFNVTQRLITLLSAMSTTLQGYKEAAFVTTDE